MFEERFIAFVDILGFKEIVKQATNDIAYQDKNEVCLVCTLL